jgi:hypothetical protein
MMKLLISLLLLSSLGFAKMVNGVAMTVDGEPITLYEIRDFAKTNKISINEAVTTLVQSKMEEKEIAETGIYATPQEIEMQLEKLANANNLSKETFLREFKKQGEDEAYLRERVEKKVKRDKLYGKLLSRKRKTIDEEMIRSQYELHKKEFKMPTKIELIEYLSSSAEALQMKQMNPMMMLPNLKVNNRTVPVNKLNPQLAMLLLKTKNNSFTPIIGIGPNESAMFYVKRKIEGEQVPYEKAKNAIAAKLIKEAEQAILIEHFEKKKSEANIVIIRKP